MLASSVMSRAKELLEEDTTEDAGSGVNNGEESTKGFSGEPTLEELNDFIQMRCDFKAYGDIQCTFSPNARVIILRKCGRINSYYDDAIDHNFLIEIDGANVSSELILAVEKANTTIDFFSRASIVNHDYVLECKGKIETFDYDKKRRKITSVHTNRVYNVIAYDSDNVKQFMLPAELLMIAEGAQVVLSGNCNYAVKG